MMVRAPAHTLTINHQQEQTPSYLPSYTRLGHAIPGSKTVSVGGVCVLVFRARANTLIIHIYTPVHTDRVHVNMSSINMYVGRERSSGLIKMTCYVTRARVTMT